MLVMDFMVIGNKLFRIRKRLGMTQADVAEAAGLSDRTYADIERGTVNMRIDTILRICAALHITPDEILTDEDPADPVDEAALLEQFRLCSPKDRKTALALLSVYLKSLES